MTFDDGILTVFALQNTAEPGKKPVYGLIEKAQCYYGYDQLGITRFYTALQANQHIEAVINIPGWEDILSNDVVILKEKPDTQYQVKMVQPTMDENGLRIMKLTLERIGHNYEVPGIS